MRLPHVVGMPRVQMLSLTATRTPARGPEAEVRSSVRCRNAVSGSSMGRSPQHGGHGVVGASAPGRLQQGLVGGERLLRLVVAEDVGEVEGVGERLDAF